MRHPPATALTARFAAPFAAALAALLGACSEPPPPPAGSGEPAPTAERVHQAVALTPEQEAGRVTYESVCWTCHGSGGHGDGPARADDAAPPSFHSAGYAGVSHDELLRRFEASLAGDDPDHPHMQNVVKLVRAESFTEALAFIPALAYPAEVPGSALHGQAVYAFRCAGCHGEAGRGDGPGAAHMVELPPSDFTTDTLVAAANWDAMFARIRQGGDRVHGSIMPAWGQVLGDGDVWDLVAYLATFQPGVVAPPSWGR